MEINEITHMEPRPAKRVETDLDQERRALGQRAFDKLGYPGLKEATRAKNYPLLDALKKLEIVPYDNASVERYKQSKRKIGMYSERRGGLFLWGITASIGLSMLTYLLPGTPEVTFDVGFPALLGGVISCFVGVGLFVENEGRRLVVDWRRYTLDKFHGDIPEHVLIKALEIKAAAAKAEFIVEALHHSVEELLPDPFLQVVLGSEIYYIDCWNEKKYERTL